MRKEILNYALLMITSLLIACGGGEEQTSVDDVIASNNLEEIQAKRAELETQKQELESSIARLDEVVEQLDSNKKLPLVSVLPIAAQTFHHFVELQGDVETDQNIILYPEYQGILKKVHVKMGDQVSQGQLIATIDDGGLIEQLQQAEYKANLSKITYERQERLWKKNIGSEIGFLQAQTAYQADQKLVEQLQDQLGKTTINAPFSGIIDDILTDEGQVVGPGQSPVVRLVNLNDMHIKADVPESYLATVTKNKMVKVDFPFLDTMITTKVEKVSNYINPDNRTYKIEIDVPNESGMVKPNLTAKLMVNDYTNEKAFLIPQSLISENAEGEQYVYLAKNEGGKTLAQRVFIKTGKKQGDVIEIVEGLSDGVNIIEEGARTVRDNQEIEIKE